MVKLANVCQQGKPVQLISREMKQKSVEDTLRMVVGKEESLQAHLSHMERGGDSILTCKGASGSAQFPRCPGLRKTGHSQGLFFSQVFC